MQCETRLCNNHVNYQFARIESRHVTAETNLCEEHARQHFEEFRSSSRLGTGKFYSLPNAVCVDFELLVYNQCSDTTSVCIYLHEVGGYRRFALLTDSWNWWHLIMQLKHIRAPYPLPHDVWAETIRQLGGEVQYVLVDSYDNAKQWFGAKLQLFQNGKSLALEIRPVDAYILALCHGAPIFVTERILDNAAVREMSRA